MVYFLISRLLVKSDLNHQLDTVYIQYIENWERQSGFRIYIDISGFRSEKIADRRLSVPAAAIKRLRHIVHVFPVYLHLNTERRERMEWPFRGRLSQLIIR